MAQETEIEIPSRGGVRGRIEKLAHEYTLKAAALRITVEILDEDDRKTALAAAPKKFLKAITQRNNGHAPRPGDPEWLTVTADDGVPLAQIPRTPKRQPHKPRAVRVKEITAYLKAHPGAITTDITKAFKMHSGSSLRSILWEVAKPARPVKPRQTISWVLR